MNIDLSLVVYRPNAELLGATLFSLSRIRSEFHLLYILLSGGNHDRSMLNELVEKNNLNDKVFIAHRFDNLGFSAGHNFLLDVAFSSGGDAVMVINPDIEISPGAVTELASAAATANTVALFGPVIRQLGGAEGEKRIDSAGIVWTATGRHFDDFQGAPDFGADGSLRKCAGVTGACLLVARSAYEAIVADCGYFFDDHFIAYREDAELGIRAGMVGVPSIVVNVAGFSHVRSVRGAVRGNGLADLLGVRNRFLMKWRMGRRRPGGAALSFVRDAIVILGVIVKERSSLPGLLEAFSVRKYMMYTSPYRGLI